MSEPLQAGGQSWAESMSARDRIQAVAETLREPRSVNRISEQADAAWSTTNEELQDFVNQGQLRRVETGETMRYQPDYTRLLFEEIRTLIVENTREELRNELAAITEEIEAWQATDDVETWEEIERSLADGSLSSVERHERRDVITRWEEWTTAGSSYTRWRSTPTWKPLVNSGSTWLTATQTTSRDRRTFGRHRGRHSYSSACSSAVSWCRWNR